jgi:hypothetical protein
MIAHQNPFIAKFGTDNKYTVPTGKRFGNWDWKLDVTDIPNSILVEIQKVCKTYLIKLYNNGSIRYASW